MLIDFGHSARTLYGTPTGYGTRGYMAPETFSKDARLSTAVDLYSAGVLLLELGVGQKLTIKVKAALVRVASLGEVNELLANCGLPPSHLSPSLFGLVCRLLDPNPAGRPTATEMASLLKASFRQGFPAT